MVWQQDAVYRGWYFSEIGSIRSRENYRDGGWAIPEDPGQAGKGQAQHLVRLLAGYTVRVKRANGDKETRFGAFSAQAEAGNVDILRGDWNDQWATALEAFPDASHDDDVDSTSEAFNLLTTSAQVVPFCAPIVVGTPRHNPW